MSEIDSGDIAWMLVFTGLVMIMIPPLGFFDVGVLRSENATSMIMQCFSGLATLSVLWIVIRFSLTISQFQVKVN
ncbi:MAG TPA: hypothetical protein VFV86_10780 [Nitrososphaeraceae archaeon]|nr:hypothetical protein [Nitrososphaeraceae archaeon]